jgi:hypothetical protein
MSHPHICLDELQNLSNLVSPGQATYQKEDMLLLCQYTGSSGASDLAAMVPKESIRQCCGDVQDKDGCLLALKWT